MAGGQTHRFRDVVGLCVGTGPTAYMTADEADKLAKQLRKIARSIRRERFSASPPLTLRFDTFEEAHEAEAAITPARRAKWEGRE